MPRENVERQVEQAVARLGQQAPIRAPNCRLTDANLVLEAGVSRATVYRCAAAMDAWRALKEEALRLALRQARQVEARGGKREGPKAVLRRVGLEPSALRGMPEDLKDEFVTHVHSSGREPADRPEAIIETLVARVFALTMAVRQRDEIIVALEEEIERLGGNILPLRP